MRPVEIQQVVGADAGAGAGPALTAGPLGGKAHPPMSRATLGFPASDRVDLAARVCRLGPAQR